MSTKCKFIIGFNHFDFKFIYIYFLFQVYYYYPFSALSDPAKLYNDLRWNVTRPQGFEAVMRVRCSQVSSHLLTYLLPLSSFLYSMLFKVALQEKLMFLSYFPGYSSSRVLWKLLQTSSNRR